MAAQNTDNILIGVTGSVAAIKLIELIEELKSRHGSSQKGARLHCKVIQTENSKHFVSKDCLTKHFNNSYDGDDVIVDIYDDRDEWIQWSKMNDPVLHIEVRKWAHLLVIAPLDANTMAKMANGICDNLLTCVVRAWDLSKPLIYCPAMNVHMYEHPMTREHLSRLQSLGYLRVDCVEKKLACGDIGMGGMAAIDTIARQVVACLTMKNYKLPV